MAAPAEREVVALLVVHGTADPVFPLAHGEALARAVADAKFVNIPMIGKRSFLPSTNMSEGEPPSSDRDKTK